MCVSVCVCARVYVGERGGQKHLSLPCPLKEGKHSPQSLELSFEAQSSLQIFEVLSLVFLCNCNGKDYKVIKFWNTSDTSVIYSIKSTRCGSMMYFYTCSLSPHPLLMHYYFQCSFSP